MNGFVDQLMQSVLVTENIPSTPRVKMILEKILVFVLLLGVSLARQPALPRSLGKVTIRLAAYMDILYNQGDPSKPMSDGITIFISTFNPINSLPDPKYMIRSPGRKLDDISQWDIQEIDRTALWPNNPDPVPIQVFGTERLIWSSGFLLPAKTAGKLELYDPLPDPPKGPFNIAASDNGTWSYHRVVWKDLDNDGDHDALTARFFKPIGGDALTELVWFENPGLPMEETPEEGWKQHVIDTGSADVHFRNVQLASQGVEYDCLITAEFWNEQLVLFYSQSGDWASFKDVGKVVIDDSPSLGQTFDLYVDDFNMDGKLEILVTAYNFTFGNVYVYEIPEDIINGEYVRHRIAQGFIANDIIGGQSMTPGSPKPFYPSEAYKNEELPDGRKRKPFIMVSGDDDGHHYILEPLSEDPKNWAYNKHVLVDTGGTISGKFIVEDLDGDGYTEIIAAGYSSGTLYAYTYAPPV